MDTNGKNVGYLNVVASGQLSDTVALHPGKANLEIILDTSQVRS
jgi:hypothetical protein